jgi:hypothetical protein
VLEDYTSHVVENLRLLDELVRIKDRINLPKEKQDAYKALPHCLGTGCILPKAHQNLHLERLFEDIRFDPINLNRVNNSPMEFARYLLKNPQRDTEISLRFRVDMVGEKYIWRKRHECHQRTNGCYLPMGSHTSRYASICAMWYEHSGDRWFKEEAYRFFNHASYMAEPDGVVQTGHNWGAEIWFSDGYTDYIRHFMEGLAAVPEWAPAGENHLLNLLW